MVEMTEFRFPLNSRVRLRDNVDPGLYNSMSRTGNEGWVRERRLDKYDFPQVLIEWDKEHWAYNGTKDGWTWEDHFEGVEMADKQEKSEVSELAEMMRSFLERIDPQTDQKDDTNGEREQYQQDAKSLLEDSESFILITTHSKADDPDTLIPQAMRYSGSKAGQILTELQLSQLGARSHHGMAAELLENDGS